MINKAIFYASLLTAASVAYAADITPQLEQIRQAAKDRAQQEITALKAEISSLDNRLQEQDELMQQKVSEFGEIFTKLDERKNALLEEIASSRAALAQVRDHIGVALAKIKRARDEKKYQLDELEQRTAEFIDGFQLLRAEQPKFPQSPKHTSSPNGRPERSPTSPAKPALMPSEVWERLPPSMQGYFTSRP